MTSFPYEPIRAKHDVILLDKHVRTPQCKRTGVGGPSKAHFPSAVLPGQLLQLFAPATMSKRPADVMPTRPTKLWKLDSTQPTAPKTPMSSGPKRRVYQSYVLNYSPRLEATISLKDLQPEIRFASLDGILLLSASDFLKMAEERDSWSSETVFLDDARLESNRDGGLVFLEYARENHPYPSFFDIPPEAAKRLREKLDFMCDQVRTLQANQEVFSVMQECIVKTMKTEYTRHRSVQPLSELFDELYRLIQCHVTPTAIVKDFVRVLEERSLTCSFNYYHVLSMLVAQRAYLRSLC